MAKQKTLETSKDVLVFISEYTQDEQKRADSRALLKIMEQITGCNAKMWGSSIIGFGKYQYRYSSGHRGEAPLLGFSPRKAAISLYVFTGLEKHKPLLENLGEFKMGKACIYIKKLADIDSDVLHKLMEATLNYLEKEHSVVK